MKKNISINISGIIFHIEEDGFDRLQEYLEAINKYFSQYEDSKEIIEDIESRIAEIFLGKLTEEKQIITAEDVAVLITTMGTIADFEATIDVDEEDLATDQQGERQKESSQQTQSESTGPDTSYESPKRLSRAKNRKVLGGVAAGMAHYFNVDPIWIRLIFIALFINIFWGGISGVVLLGYIILWIVLPEVEVEEDSKIKKLYRDPEDRVLGGVASGLAAYFGADKAVIRLLFVLSILLGGSGIIIYLILWIITPEAQTITEKMQMQGEPVTLSNIESNIKSSLNVKEGEENALVKVLLFPFRLIAMVIEALGKALGPILRFAVDGLRVLAGIILFIIGLSSAVSFIVALGAFLGVYGWSDWVMLGDIPEPVVVVRSIIPDAGIVFGFIAGIVPALALMIAGLSIAVKRLLIKGYALWSLLGIWLIGLLGVAFTVPATIVSFRKEAYVKETQTFNLDDNKTPVLSIKYLDNDLSDVDLRLRGHDGPEFKLVTEYKANGRTREDAKINAKMVTYTVTQQDSLFIFDSEYEIKDQRDFEFRFQEVDVIFYIPYNTVFKMDADLSSILVNTLHLNGYRAYQMGGNDWVFTEAGINCMTCDAQYDDRDKYIPGTSNDFDLNDYSGDRKVLDIENFNEIKANGSFEIEIIQADDYSIEVKGTRRLMDDADIFKSGNKLVLDFDREWDWFKRYNRHEKIGVTITMPDIEAIDLSGASKVYIRNFKGDDIAFDLTGASYVQALVDINEINADLSGASKLVVKGGGTSLKADISGASTLEAANYSAEYVKVEASGASKGEVYSTKEIEIDASGASRVKYNGTENVRVDIDGGSRVIRDNSM